MCPAKTLRALLPQMVIHLTHLEPSPVPKMAPPITILEPTAALIFNMTSLLSMVLRHQINRRRHIVHHPDPLDPIHT